MQFFNDEGFSWRVLAAESVVIMLSVLLGFTLNGWRESASQQETVDAALQSIAAEAQQNIRELEDRQPYYRSLRDTLAHLMAEKGPESPLRMQEVPGLHTIDLPELRTSSFEAVRSTGALSNMDFDLANTISEVYGLHDLYRRGIDQPTNRFLMGEFDTVGDYFRYYAMRINMGKRLPQRYAQLLSELEERGVEIAPRAGADSLQAAR